MNIRNWARIIVKCFYSITEVTAWIGYVSIAFIVLLVFVDVCGRYFFNKPFVGALELVELTMAISGGVAITYAAVKRGHIALDLLITRFSRHSQIIIQRIFSFLGFVTWLVISYQVYLYSLNVLQESKTTAVLRISIMPFLLFLAVAALLSSLTLLIQTFYQVETDATIGKKKEAINEP